MKNENLKKARENGFPIPEFISIGFDEVLSDSDRLDAALDSADYSDIKALSEKLTRLLRESSRYDKEIALKGELFAVRSSCSAEDNERTSFAGQFETFLNVRKEDVRAVITDCVASLYSESALRCALENSIDLKTLKMNVIVQCMVDAELSGVLFTANPQGILNESVIVVGKGLGDGVVSDKADTTSYYYASADKVYYSDGKENLLSHNTLTELIKLSEELKLLFDNELLDIEFAIEKGIIYILQIRPITTLSTEHPTVLDNSNIVESYPGLSLPLTESFVKLVYSGVFRSLAMRVLKNRRIIEKYSDVFSSMVGSANGRMYYKISNWYTVIKFLPLSSRIIPIWQEMLGVKVKSHSSEKVSLSPAARLKTYFNSVYELLHVPRNMERLEAEFSRISDGFYEKFSGELSDTELVGLFEEIRTKLLAVWDVTLLNDMYSFIFTGLVKARLKKTDPEDYERISADYLSGISNIESMKPIKALAVLAKLSLQDRDSEEYREKYNEYIRLYGDRYLEELKLESRTFRTDNSLLDKKIDEYANDGERLSRLLSSDCKEKEAPEKKGAFFSFFLRRAVLGIKNREASRLNRSRVFGMVRSIFLRLAQSFTQKGIITNERDIFYLSVDEVFALVEKPCDMRRTVERRKLDYEVYKQLPEYSRLIFSDGEFNKTGKTINTSERFSEDGTLQGIPCSNGRAEGEALLVSDVSMIGDVKGRILVTRTTDPGWVFLLAGAAGIIAEKGSLLSHTAIVSREIGIPSVVGVENALNIIRNGDRVSIDGSSGIIEIVR